MKETPPPTGDWSDAVSQASEHVQERAQAIEEAAERQKPRSRGPLLAALAVVFLGVIAWDVYVFTQPPEIPPPAQEAVDLRWFVVDVVEVIEDFRAENGRLPSRADLGDLIDDEVDYRLQGDTYVVSLEGEAVAVQYSSAVPLQEWVSSGGNASGGAG